MTFIDTPTLSNVLVTGLIALISGAISAWLVYRLNRRRDDIAWERKEQELQKQFKHELDVLKAQVAREQETSLREDLLTGIKRPSETVTELERTRVMLVQGDRDGIPVSFPRMELIKELMGIVAQVGSRAEISQLIDLWEAEHGPLGAERSATIREMTDGEV